MFTTVGPLLKWRFLSIGSLRYGKTGNEKTSICSVTLLQNKLNSVAVRFTTHLKKPRNLIWCKTGLNVGGNMCNIAVQLILQQCCKTSCIFFVAWFTVALSKDILEWRTPTRSEAFFLFNMPWRYQVCIVKCLFFYRDDLPKNLGKTIAFKNANISLPVDVCCSMMSLLKLSNIWCAFHQRS